MKLNKIVKFYIIISMIIIFMNIISNFSVAFSLKEVISSAKDFSTTKSEISTERLKEAQSVVYNILYIAGVIISVVGTAVMGIQFMVAAPEGKAELKQRMFPYVVGCIVIFLSVTIWKFAVNIVQGI